MRADGCASGAGWEKFFGIATGTTGANRHDPHQASQPPEGRHGRRKGSESQTTQ
jgi:hypothetical protein